MPLWLILDGLTDPRNAGSMFRLADAARLAGMILINMEGVMQSGKTQKVARSTTEWVPYLSYSNWSTFSSPVPGMRILALEWTNKSIPFHREEVSWPLGLIVGNEQHGVSKAALQICSGSIHIPMLGLNSSMNVSMAAGIAVYGLLGKGGYIS